MDITSCLTVQLALMHAWCVTSSVAHSHIMHYRYTTNVRAYRRPQLACMLAA